MEHRASSDFWQEYGALPQQIRERADKQFLLLKPTRNTLRCNSRRSANATGKRFGQPVSVEKFDSHKG
jgi:hypothetical protein